MSFLVFSEIILYIVGGLEDLNHFLIDLFPPKDDLLPHVTGGFRGRAITVGSLEYDPWMKFVRFVILRKVENLRNNDKISGTARAT